jgi:hypothetical protein
LSKTNDEKLTDDDEYENNEMSAFRPSHCLDYSDLDDHAAFKQHIEEIGACKLAGATKGNRILLQYQTYLAVNSDLNLKPKQVGELPRDLSCVRRSGLLGILLVLLYVSPIPRSVNERVGELLCGLRRFSNNNLSIIEKR